MLLSYETALVQGLASTGSWVSALRSFAPVLRDLGAQLESQPLADIMFPHFLSGPLDARQRLEFLRFHIEQHLQQVQRVRAAPAFPSASSNRRV